MVVINSPIFLFRKWFAVYIYPVVAVAYIAGDWYQTKLLKEGKRPAALDEILKLGDKVI